MKWNQRLRILVGSAIWLGGIVALGWWCLDASHRADRRRVAESLLEFASGRRQAYAWQADAALPLMVGDPIFLVDGPDSIRRIGEVSRCDAASAQPITPLPPGVPVHPGLPVQLVVKGDVLFYGTAPPLPAGARLTYHETPRNMQWVIETMLPPDKRLQIQEELQATLRQHQAEIMDAIRPVVEAAWRDALPVVEQDLTEALARHGEELQRLGGKYQQEIVQRELVPLVKHEVWPIVVRHAQPTVNEVGREIWQQASVWRFGWRYAYDLSPLPEKRLLEGEWNRFVREDASPILASHVDDFVRVQQRILSDVAANPRVREAMHRSLEHLLHDPELHELVASIFREVLMDNPRLREVLRKHWESEEARQAIQLASTRLEPLVLRIGQLLLGTPEQGITPEFAQVLRNQILKKDQRWLVLELPSQDAREAPPKGRRGGRILTVEPGTGPAVNPFSTPARVDTFSTPAGDTT